LVFIREFRSEKDARAYEKKVKERRVEQEEIIREIENRK
jgi:hypothetical protein